MRNAKLLRDVSALPLLRNRAWTGAPFFGVYLAGSYSLHPRLWRSCHLALSRRSMVARQLIVSRSRNLRALRPIICGDAAGVDGGAAGAIGLVAVAGVMLGAAAPPAPAPAHAHAHADAAAPFIRTRLAVPWLERSLPHGPGPIRARRPPPDRSFSLTDDGAGRSQGGADLPFRPGACASWRRASNRRGWASNDCP